MIQALGIVSLSYNYSLVYFRGELQMVSHRRLSAPLPVLIRYSHTELNSNVVFDHEVNLKLPLNLSCKEMV